MSAKFLTVNEICRSGFYFFRGNTDWDQTQSTIVQVQMSDIPNCITVWQLDKVGFVFLSNLVIRYPKAQFFGPIDLPVFPE